MSLVDHLRELRRRLIYAVIALVIGSIIGFIWYQLRITTPWFSISSLGDILRGPYCSLPEESRADFSFDGECRLLATSPFEMFLLRMKVGALAGIVLSSPVWLYQIWAFITPGLHKTERRSTFTFVSLAVLLFVSGAVMAYFVVDYGLAFLMGIGDEFQTAALTGEKYFNFVLALLLIFGVSFEVPLIIGMLNVVGILTYESIKDKRRVIVIALFVFAALMTPGQDPFSMLILAFALNVLVELSLQFCRWNDKRRNRQRPDWLDQDDDSASALDYRPEPIAPAPTNTQVQTHPVNPTSAPQRPTGSFGGGGNFDDVL
ncbi:twin-arginine translocase subunit TatC [Corynebacterium occultum]|nr:twin-arginine translocase subunit TatC [Corynebacterium occultum]